MGVAFSGEGVQPLPLRLDINTAVTLSKRCGNSPVATLPEFYIGSGDSESTESWISIKFSEFSSLSEGSCRELGTTLLCIFSLFVRLILAAWQANELRQPGSDWPARSVPLAA